ncbi:MAG: helix-turn-helix domain-containing protein [Desulfatiglandales bacterium]
MASTKNQSIGNKIRLLRRKKGLSLKQLGNDTGLKPQYISQIEKGEVIPPVAVLLQISKALEIDSGILLSEERKKIKEKSLDDYQKRTESYAYVNLTPNARHKHLKAFKVTIDPESEHKGVSYQHPGEEFIYVLKGKVEVMVGENQNIVEENSCIHFDSSIQHKITNLSPEKAELLVVLYTP